jgi:hypothetical protein
MVASQTGTEALIFFFLSKSRRYQRLTRALMIKDNTTPAIITVDSRWPRGINEK